MFKKLTAMLLVFVLTVTLSSCYFMKKKDAADAAQNDASVRTPVVSEEVTVGDKKVAILVPAGSQFNEGMMAAKKLQTMYPNNVIVKEYSNSNNLSDNRENSLIKVSEEVASDTSVGAVVYAKSTRLTNEAITAAKALNPDIRVICVEPEVSMDKLAEKSDLVLCTDWSSAAADIVACAKAQGAEYFVMTSFDRHISGLTSDSTSLLNATAKSAISSECEKQEITFVYHNAPDPISSGGTNAVVKDIRESIVRYKEEGKINGENVAIFSTDYFIQSEIIKIANENKYIYVGPSSPTPYNGVCDVYSTALPENPYDTANYKAALAKAATGNARFCFYNYPLETVLLTGAVHTAFDMIAGKTTKDNLEQRVTLRLKDAAADDKFTVIHFGGTENVYSAYCPAFEALK